MDDERDALPPFRACVQCGRCSAGCPVAFESEHTPRKIVRLLQRGCLKEACESPFLWLCASCRTCTARCPRGVDVSAIVFSLRRVANEKGWVMPGERLVFYRAFAGLVKEKGRISELRLGIRVASRKLPEHPLGDAALLLKLARRGRIR